MTFLMWIGLFLFTVSADRSESKVIVSWGFWDLSNGITAPKKVVPDNSLLERCKIEFTSKEDFLKETKFDWIRYEKIIDRVGNVNLVTVDQVLCMSSSLDSRARNNIEVIRKAAIRNLEKIQKYVPVIGGKSVRDIIEVFKTHKFRAMPGGLLLDRNGLRGTGLNIKSEKLIVFSLPMLRQLKARSAVWWLYLHEVLGMLGISDNDYQATASIVYLLDHLDQSHEVLKILRRVDAKLKGEYQVAGSTGTIIGSGGDQYELWYKVNTVASLPGLMIDLKNSKDPKLLSYSKLEVLETLMGVKMRTRGDISVPEYEHRVFESEPEFDIYRGDSVLYLPAVMTAKLADPNKFIEQLGTNFLEILLAHK